MIDLFEGWGGVLRVVVVGTLAYAGLVVVLRATGKRTLSKMNAFDLMVTVALGSSLASTMLSPSVPLAEGLAGMALLVLLQFAVTWASVRSGRVRALVKASPALLAHGGLLRRGAMRRERVTEDEILAALRQAGLKAMTGDVSVVLETDGSLTVLTGAASGGAPSTLPDPGPSAGGAGT